jgi:hypothetical protein
MALLMVNGYRKENQMKKCAKTVHCKLSSVRIFIENIFRMLYGFVFSSYMKTRKMYRRHLDGCPDGILPSDAARASRRPARRARCPPDSQLEAGGTVETTNYKHF